MPFKWQFLRVFFVLKCMFLRQFTQIFGLPHLNSTINHTANHSVQQPVPSINILFKRQHALFMRSQLLIELAITYERMKYIESAMLC